MESKRKHYEINDHPVDEYGRSLPWREEYEKRRQLANEMKIDDDKENVQPSLRENEEFNLSQDYISAEQSQSYSSFEAAKAALTDGLTSITKSLIYQEEFQMIPGGKRPSV